MGTISNPRNPRFADASGIAIILDVDLIGIGSAEFVARADDLEQSGRALYRLARGGSFGAVAAYFELAPPDITAAQVDRERDRRIDAGFVFAGVLYQSRPADRENIAGASTAALAAIVNGAQAGDLRWASPDVDFVWIAADNSLHTMDAQTMFEFGKAAMAHKQAHIFAARAIKDISPIPADYATNPAYWPA
jgi:hypothetical protein